MRAAAAAPLVFLLGAAASTAQPPAATIRGHVRLTTAVRGAALPSNVYQPRAIGRHAPAATAEIRNVVVYLKNPPFTAAPAAGRHVVAQRNETFTPRVLAVTRGSVVSFPNEDPYFHNVFSLSGAATFDLGRYPQGKTREQRLGRAGLVKVYCHIHSHMSASILVLDHPYFTVPDLDGSFRLPDVPPGRHTVVGWHERVGERTAAVEVSPGGIATIELSLPVEDAP
jgi:plastocyanin